MFDKEKIDAALKFDQLDMPDTPRVEEISWEPYEDWQGNDSLRITVVLPDDTTDGELMSGGGGKIQWNIFESLRRHGVELFPYTFFATKRELALVDEDRA